MNKVRERKRKSSVSKVSGLWVPCPKIKKILKFIFLRNGLKWK